MIPQFNTTNLGVWQTSQALSRSQVRINGECWRQEGHPAVKTIAKIMMSASQRVAIYVRAYPECDAQRPRLTSETVQGLPRCERTRLKKRASEGLRVASMNVGTLAGRGREVVELMEMRRVSILCVQETRWKRNKAKELGEGYKLYYSAATTDGRNGVGIIVSEKIKQYVTDVKRERDRLMVLRLVYGDCPVNIMSAYASQTGLPEEVKEEFWVDVRESYKRISRGGASYSGSRFKRTHRIIR